MAGWDDEKSSDFGVEIDRVGEDGGGGLEVVEVEGGCFGEEEVGGLFVVLEDF